MPCIWTQLLMPDLETLPLTHLNVQWSTDWHYFFARWEFISSNSLFMRTVTTITIIWYWALTSSETSLVLHLPGKGFRRVRLKGFVCKLSNFCSEKTHDMLLLLRGLAVKRYQQKYIMKQKLFPERTTSTKKLSLCVKCHGDMSDKTIGRITVFILGKNFQKLFKAGFQSNKIIKLDCGLSSRLLTKLFW